MRSPGKNSCSPAKRAPLAARDGAIALGIALAIWLGSVHAAWADQFQFYLRNGDRLTGTVVAEDKVSLIITNSLIGRILIPVAQLDRREPMPAATVKPPPGPTIAKAAAPNPPPALSAAQRKRLDDLTLVYMAGEISAAEFQSRRTTIMAPGPAAPKRWSGELFAGIDLGYGTKSRQFFSGRAKVNYVQKRFRNALDYLFTYGHTEGELAANRMDATDKLDYDLESKYYLYALGGAGHDEIRRIDYYLQAGPGLGKHLIQRTNLVLNVEAGANYQMQNFEGGDDTFFFYYRVGQDLKWAITPKFTFDEKIEYTPQWDDPGQYKIRGEANLRFWVLENLSLNLSVIDLYDTRVPPNVNPNDLQIRSSIGIKF